MFKTDGITILMFPLTGIVTGIGPQFIIMITGSIEAIHKVNLIGI